MDWLGVKFCVIIWVLCISELQAEPPVNNVNELKCIEGQAIPPPDECNTCICFDGEIHCTRLVCSPKNVTSPEPECISGEHIPKPDDCNDCICFGGEIHCSNRPCLRKPRIGPECNDSQPVYRPDECNECYCFEGRLECSDLVCIRGSKCEEGQVIPKPDSCNMCICHEGHILCTIYQCNKTILRSSIDGEDSSAEIPSLHCQEGDYIPPPPPPDDCNTCLCINQRVLCTMEKCPAYVPDISGRLKKKEQNNINNYLQSFDKPISVEPFINLLSQNSDRIPTKLIHTHAYKGFHQEIKVHTKHLPKDRAKLLTALANTLNNPTLEDIGNNIKITFSNYNNPVPLDDNSLPNFRLPKGNIVPKNSLDSSEIQLTHSSKLITSGSQSNETILVIPEYIDGKYKKTAIPLKTQQESYWDAISAPDPQIYSNIYQNIPNSGEVEKTVEYYSESPPSFDKYETIHTPVKFGYQSQHSIVKPTNPTRNILDVTDQYSEPVTTLNYQSINIKDTNMSESPFYQDDKQNKSISSTITDSPNELELSISDQVLGPVDVYILNETSSHAVYIPNQEKRIAALDNEGIQPLHQLEPNQDQFNLPENEAETHQKPPVPNMNSKSGMDNPIEKQSQTTAYTQPKPGFKLKFIIHQKNDTYYFTPPNTESKLDQDTHLSMTDNETPTQKSPHAKNKLNPTEYYSDDLIPQTIEVLLDHRNLYKPQAIISNFETQHRSPEIQSNPQRQPNDTVSNSHLATYNLAQPALETDRNKVVSIPHQDVSSNNNTNPSYSEILGEQNNVPFVEDKYNPPYQSHAQPEGSLLDTTMAKVYKYLAQPSYTGVEPKQSENKTHQVQLNLSQPYKYYPTGPEVHSQYDKYKTPLNKPPHIQSNGQINTNQNQIRLPDQPHVATVNQFKPTQPDFELSHSNRNPGVFNEKGYIPHTSENPTIKQNNQLNQNNLPQFKPLGRPNSFIFDHQASTDGSQFLPDSEQELAMSKINSPKSYPSRFQSVPNPPKLNFIYDRGSVDQFLHKPHLPIDYVPPEVNQPKSSQSIIILPPDQQKPITHDNRAPAIGYKDTSHSGEQLLNTKFNEFKPPLPKNNLPQNPNSLENFDERGSTGGFQYISHSGEDPKKAKVNQINSLEPLQVFPKNPGTSDNHGLADGLQSHPVEHSKHTKIIHYKPRYPLYYLHKSQNNSETIDNRVSFGGLQNTSHFVENPTNTKVNHFKPFQPQYKIPQNAGILDDRGSPNGFQVLSHSGEVHTNTKAHQFKPHQPQHILPHNRETFDDRGSADGFQYTSHSGEVPMNKKVNHYKPRYPLYYLHKSQKILETVDNRGSVGGSQITLHFVEDPTNTKVSQFKPSQPQYEILQNPEILHDRGSPNGSLFPSQSGEDHTNIKAYQFKPLQLQHILPQNPETLGNRGSADGFQYTSNSGEDPTSIKVNQFKPSQPQYKIPQNPKILDDRGSVNIPELWSHLGENHTNTTAHHINPLHPQQILSQNSKTLDDRGSADGFQYTSHSGEDPTIPKVNQYKPLQLQYVHHQNQQNPETYDNRASADGFQYPSYSGEDPVNIKIKSFPENQQSQSIDDQRPAKGQELTSSSAENPTISPQQQAQDNLKLWSIDDPEEAKTIQIKTKSYIIKTKSEVDAPFELQSNQNQSIIIPDVIPIIYPSVETSKTEQYDYETWKSHKPDHDQYKPVLNDGLLNGAHHIPWSINNNSNSIEQNPSKEPLFQPDKIQNKASISDDSTWMIPKLNKTLDDNALQPKQGNISTTDLDVINSNPNTNTSLYTTVQKYVELTSTDNSEENSKFAASVISQLQLFPNLLPVVLDTFEPASESKINKGFKSPGVSGQNNPKSLNMLTSYQNILNPNLPNQQLQGEISKGFPKTSQMEVTNNYSNLPQKKVPEGNLPLVEFPDVNIILHQPSALDDTSNPEFLDSGLDSRVTDIKSEDEGTKASLLPKLLRPRFKYRSKDKKEECGDGTEWISNCHECSCRNGLSVCTQIPECTLRPLGEPMICKPYSHFKMGNCYSCECNGDGVPECDASDCKEEGKGKEGQNVDLPIYDEFFDEKKAKDLVQYYNFYKMLPNECPRHKKSHTSFPTCEVGTRWVSSCKKCECDDSGKHNCTTIDDCVLNSESYGKPSRCKPNSKFYPKTTGMPCVECQCDDEGNPFCPLKDHKRH